MNAALVMDEGKFNPFVISLHNFLFITSTSPPFDTTNRNNSYRSNVCFAIIGILLTGVPTRERSNCIRTKEQRLTFFSSSVTQRKSSHTAKGIIQQTKY